MNCLLITDPKAVVARDLLNFLQSNQVPCLTISDPLTGIQKAQEQHFDVILLDAKPKGIKIDKAIQILKGCDPKARIIVHTVKNSKNLESAVRKQQIFYYHLDSFGIDDLRLAISSALGLRKRASSEVDKSKEFKPI